MGTKAKILVECHHLTSGAGTGLATYARNLALAVHAAGHDTAALFGVDARPHAQDPALRRVELFDARPASRWRIPRLAELAKATITADFAGVQPTVVHTHGLVVPPDSFLSQPAMAEAHVVPALAARARAHFRRYGTLMDVHVTSDIGALHASHVIPLRAKGAPTLTTIHDIIPLRLPYAIMDNKAEFHRLITKIVRDTDHIVTVSEHSRRDLISFFGVPESRISNTWQAVSIDPQAFEKTDDALADELAATHGLTMRDYYLFVGAIEPKKNLSRLIDAYLESGTQRPLVLAGGLGWQYEQDLKRIHDRRLTSLVLEPEGAIRRHRRIRHLKYVPRNVLYSLIRGARALVFPSLYEGFGLPVLEAMALGTPVITSNTSSLPEVAGEAALLVDPMSTSSISDAIRTIDNDDALMVELEKRGLKQASKFSPERYAERMSDLYSRIL